MREPISTEQKKAMIKLTGILDTGTLFLGG